MKPIKVNDESKCPVCGASLDGATDPTGDATPKAGDLSVCAYCTEFLVFNEDLTVRKMLFKELIELPVPTLTSLYSYRTALQARARLAPSSDNG